MKVIGISGKKQSGKDTVADIILSIAEEKAIKYSFGIELKKEIARACNCSLEYIEEHKALFRPMLQWWGTEYRRQLFGKDYWIKKMAQALSHLQEENFKIVIITDVRFENELQYLKYLWKAPIYRVERTNGAKVDLHPSEIALDGETFDFVLYNNGTIAELADQVKKTL
jgi:hypothetical protein